MYSKIALFILLVLIAQLSYSQSSYPKKISYGGDTVVIVTVEQSKLIITTFLQNKKLKELNILCEMYSTKKDSIIDSCMNFSENCLQLTSKLQLLSTEDTKTIQELTEKNIKAENRIKRIKFVKNIETSVVFIVTLFVTKFYL